MNEHGSLPPDWTPWLNAVGEQGVNLLRGIADSMDGAANDDRDTPLFIEAWQQALDGDAQSLDPGTVAARFSSAVEQQLQRMHESTQAGVAALEGAMAGVRKGQRGRRAEWLGDAFRTAHGQRADSGSGESLHRTFRAYVSALTDYQREFSRSVEAALEAFRSALDEREKRDRQPEGLDELHALWIESAEPAYEAVLNSGAYAEAFASLQNAAVALGKAVRIHAQPVLDALGIPSRDELSRLYSRLGELRRQQTRNRRLEAELSLLRRELDGLREEVRSLRGSDGVRREH